MTTIVDFSDHCDVNRYARRFHEADTAGAEILLFTGVQYERAPDTKPQIKTKAPKSSAKKRRRK